MDLNFYSLFRLMLTAVTIYNIIDFIRTLLRYKPYYDRIPTPIKRFLFRQVQAQLQQSPTTLPPFFYRKLREHSRDFILNTVLLLVLIVLNVSLYFI